MSLNLQTLSSDGVKIEYLRTLPAIRERCYRVHKLAKEGKLDYFDYFEHKEKDVIEFCANIIKVQGMIYDCRRSI